MHNCQLMQVHKGLGDVQQAEEHRGLRTAEKTEAEGTYASLSRCQQTEAEHKRWSKHLQAISQCATKAVTSMPPAPGAPSLSTLSARTLCMKEQGSRGRGAYHVQVPSGGAEEPARAYCLCQGPSVRKLHEVPSLIQPAQQASRQAPCFPFYFVALCYC
jgi:hypothetical protein